jgi:hypothetical protein
MPTLPRLDVLLAATDRATTLIPGVVAARVHAWQGAVAWAGMAKFTAGPSQCTETSGQMEAYYYSSPFNFQKTYLGLNTLGNSCKLQKFIQNHLNIIKIQTKFL